MKTATALLLATLFACAAEPSRRGQGALADDVEDGGAGDDAGADADTDAGASDGGSADSGSADVGTIDSGSIDSGSSDAGATSDCTGLTTAAGDFDWTISHGGHARRFLVHVPNGYVSSHFTPMVVSFHGLNSSGDEQQRFTHMNAVADEGGFIAVHPYGLNAQELGKSSFTPLQRSWNAGRCCDVAASENVDDVGFVHAMLDDLATRLCVDPKRTFATGISNGGYMSYRVACELADRFAAVAPVAGPDNTNTCAPSRKVPVMHTHGTSDYVVPYNGGLYNPSVAATMTAWKAKNGCTGASVPGYTNGDATCETWSTGCPDAPITLCTIDRGGHTWPGGGFPAILGKTSQDMDASREIWKFLAAHPMP